MLEAYSVRPIPAGRNMLYARSRSAFARESTHARNCDPGPSPAQPGRPGSGGRVLEGPRPGPGDVNTMKTAAEFCERLLACAEEHGFQEVYTNDRHMLQAAKHFHVTGLNVLREIR